MNNSLSTAEFIELHRKQEIALEQAFGAWTEENHPELATPEDTVAYVQKLREAGEDRL